MFDRQADKKKVWRFRGLPTQQHGFTLAEVLITLGIIGVVAAMTIPTLIQKQREAATVTALKKAYSTLSSAYTLAVQENGTPDNWQLGGMNNTAGMDNLNSIMSKYLKVTKNCGRNDGCFPNEIYKDLNGVDSVYGNFYSDGHPKMVLSDGTLLLMFQWRGDCDWDWGSTPALKSVCGPFYVDINGAKKPNQIGVDLFGFIYTKYGVVPLGAAVQSQYLFVSTCNLGRSSIVGWSNGESCTAWVIYNGNMDYLHCNDLTWNTKTACN